MNSTPGRLQAAGRSLDLPFRMTEPTGRLPH
jgi:hypothetical protein